MFGTFKNMDKQAAENILNANSPVIKIIQSFSHREIREEESYTDDMIIDACKALIDYTYSNSNYQTKDRTSKTDEVLILNY